MNLATIIVTRSKSCHVKTLHGVLRLNIKCLQKGLNNQIVYVNDDPFEKADVIQKCMKTHDRIVFIDFGIGVDNESIDQCFEKHEGVGCLVFPGVVEGVDWDMFKKKIQKKSTEPVSQMGLNFDTDVDRKISKNIYTVTNTSARSFVIFTKNLMKNAKDKKGNVNLHVKMFEKLREQKVKIHAFTASKLIMTYPHECISNILSAAGVKTN